MYRMYVVAGVAHVQAVALSFSQVKRGGSRGLRHRIGNAIDCPAIKTLFGGIVLREGYLKCFVGGRSHCARFREAGVTPFERWWRNPRWFACLSGIFHHYAHAVAAVVVVQI